MDDLHSIILLCDPVLFPNPSLTVTYIIIDHIKPILWVFINYYTCTSMSTSTCWVLYTVWLKSNILSRELDNPLLKKMLLHSATH